MNIFKKIYYFFCCKFAAREVDKKISPKADRKIRENLSEEKIDKMIKDSFPASDPPSTY
jgi:hypothetical protein